MFGFKSKRKQIAELQTAVEDTKDMVRRFNEGIQEQLPDEIPSKDDVTPTFVQSLVIRKEEKEVREEDLELSKQARFILVDKATEDRYELYIDSGNIMIQKLEDGEE